jgi:hypothetical protein
MTPLPLVVSCLGDYALHLIPATTDSRADEIAELAASFVEGFRVPQGSKKTLRIRRVESTDPLPPDATAASLGLRHMDWLEIYHEE